MAFPKHHDVMCLCVFVCARVYFALSMLLFLGVTLFDISLLHKQMHKISEKKYFYELFCSA